MKNWLDQSFRRKLLMSFLLIGIVPLLICTVFMLNIFRMTLDRNTQETAQTQLAGASDALDELLESGSAVLRRLQSAPTVASALAGGGASAASESVYDVLYTLTDRLRGRADFALLDRGGAALYSTGVGQGDLDVHWGLLQAARDSGGVVYRSAAAGSPLRCACAVRDGEAVLGYAVMSLSADHLEKLFSSYGSAGGLMLLDPFWTRVYQTPRVQGEDLAPRLRAQLLAGEALSSGDEYLYHVQKNAVSGFYLLLQQPEPLAGWVMRLLHLVAGVTIVSCLGLCVLVSMGLSRQLFEPVRALNAAMGEVEGGNLDVKLEVHSPDEMGQLAGRFNRMVERLRFQIAESVRRRQELSDAQIRMMQAQLNPHFLYNTLDTIKWMGKINRVPEVATIAADLGDILRSSISSDEFVALEQELRLLDRYVEIQKIRFSGRFGLRIQVDDGVLDVLVPKLMLQPLVENAIVHGFEDRDSGEITVSAHALGEVLEVTVRDNGCGMSEESLRRFQTEILPGPGRHLGLHNVDAILRLHYGPEYGLKFLPTAGEGACIRITLPITRKGGEAPC